MRGRKRSKEKNKKMKVMKRKGKVRDERKRIMKSSEEKLKV